MVSGMLVRGPGGTADVTGDADRVVVGAEAVGVVAPADVVAVAGARRASADHVPALTSRYAKPKKSARGCNAARLAMEDEQALMALTRGSCRASIPDYRSQQGSWNDAPCAFEERSPRHHQAGRRKTAAWKEHQYPD